MTDELAEAGETNDRTEDPTPTVEKDEAWGGEVEVGAGGPQPPWLRLLPYALYIAAIWYMLVNAGDSPIILTFVAGLVLWAGLSFYASFLAGRR